MNLQRRHTRFGLSTLTGTTPDSDENDLRDTSSFLKVADNESSNKLRKRILAHRDNDSPLKIRRQIGYRDEEEATPSLNGPASLQANQPKVSGNLKINHSPLQENFKEHFRLLLEDSVMISTQDDGRFVAIKEISGLGADQKLKMLEKVQHKNFLAFLGSFSFKGSYYAVFEHEITKGEKLPITLTHYALITHYPTEQQLAIILGQILEGLKYLATKGLEHGSLMCKNILISTEGSIRIACQELCHELISSRGSARDIRGVGYVTMELLNKEAIYNGPIKVRDPQRWPLESKAVQFLATTESADSIDELIEHPLFDYKRREVDIVDIRANVYTAEFSVFRGHNIIPQNN